MATTTAELIRDRAIATIAAITPAAPASGPGNAFRAHRNEQDGDFHAFAFKNPAGAFRRFQVRDDGSDNVTEVTNTDVDLRYVTFVVTIAYPQNSRTGGQNAMDRDDAIDTDWHKIDNAIGIYGKANFTGPTYPDATPLGAKRRTERTGGVDFLVIEARYSYYRATS